jgi:hypothetical protein
MGRGRKGAGRGGRGQGGGEAITDTFLLSGNVPRGTMSEAEYTRFSNLRRELRDIQAELVGIRASRNATQVRRDQRMNPLNILDTRMRAVRRDLNTENPTARGSISPYQVGENATSSQVTRLRRAQAVARNERRSGNVAGYLTRAAQIRRQMRDILQPGLFD